MRKLAVLCAILASLSMLAGCREEKKPAAASGASPQTATAASPATSASPAQTLQTCSPDASASASASALASPTPAPTLDPENQQAIDDLNEALKQLDEALKDLESGAPGAENEIDNLN